MECEAGEADAGAAGEGLTQSVAQLTSRVPQQAAPGARARHQKDGSYGMPCKRLDLSDTPLSHL